jgi:Protein of unknown function (DUF1549)
MAAHRAGPDWWSLRPIRTVTPPRFAGPDAAWIKNPIDAFILAGLNAKGLHAAPPADRATLIRRLSFDLVGLPPTPDDVDAFVADAGPQAYEALVNRFLASPRYGERWGRHWLDVVRFAESQGYETNLPRASAWPFRDYVIRALNRDIPFSRFVLEQLAGDTLGRADVGILDDVRHGPRDTDAFRGAARGPETPSRADWLTQAATGFLVGGAHDIVGNQTVEGTLQQRADDLDDMITAAGTTFLGLTIQCARCHDHKFDPITQEDYYGMQAIFAGVNHAEREVAAPDAEARRHEAAALSAQLAEVEWQLDAHEPVARPDCDAPYRPMVSPRRNVERFSPVMARMLRLTILATSGRIEPCLDEVEAYTAAVAGGPPPRNVALASAGGKAAASSEFENAPIHKIDHLNDGRVGNDHSWISRVPGKGSVTIAWPAPERIDRVVWGRDRDGAYRDRLATEYVLELALEPRRWQLVASSLDRAPFEPSAAATPGVPLETLTSEQSRAQAVRRSRQASLLARLAKLSLPAWLPSRRASRSIRRRRRRNAVSRSRAGSPTRPTRFRRG